MPIGSVHSCLIQGVFISRQDKRNFRGPKAYIIKAKRYGKTQQGMAFCYSSIPVDFSFLRRVL